ncbi:hypothetical protein ABC337_11490 [Arthrobacter sp. 1P04PC]|uniref:hypothetical protein n=1 Tax=unclassified Arthrobacter TaxID=235627 RepID=UPI0039A18070
MTIDISTDLFVAKPGKQSTNLRQAASLTAQPAVQITATGKREPAVLLRAGGQIRGVLPLAEALRVATEMADIIEAHRANQRSSGGMRANARTQTRRQEN